MTKTDSDGGNHRVDDGWKAIAKEDYQGAVEIFKAVLDEGADHRAYHGIGLAYYHLGDLLRSVTALVHAVKIDRTDPTVFALLGDIYGAQGQQKAAIENYAQAVAYKPEELAYKQKLIKAASTFKLKKINPNLKGVLLLCLETPNVDSRFFGGFWSSVVTSDPQLAAFYKLAKCKKYSAFKKGMDALACDRLIEPFFLTGLGLFLVIDPIFEQWCRYLRRYMLEAVCGGQALFSEVSHLELMMCALSRYCALADYVLSVSEGEQSLVESLAGKLEGDAKAIDLAELAMYGCYNRLHLLPNASEIAKSLQGGEHVSQIPKSQIEDVLAQDAFVIEALINEGSAKIITDEDQSEDLASPRWVVAARDIFVQEYEGHLKGAGAQILNAGCGTGQEAIQLSYVFPDAQITAIDLNRKNLAYAQFKAEELGIKNVKFMQADILALGDLDQRFDYITSAGVLHYLDDPEAGWRNLVGLLKPKGVMRIGLHSRHARWGINDARHVIQEKGIASDAGSIREFREDIGRHLKYKSIKNIQNFYDYYSLSECRNLLFHAQEHQYDLLEIKELLVRLDLDFLQFFLSGDVIRKYKRQNKEDENATDLTRWAKWEAREQNLFSSMYIFWCQKK